jgi:phage terminase large subunit-like protein
MTRAAVADQPLSADIIEFCEELAVPEGAIVGGPIKIRGWQREILEAIYDSPTRRAIISLGRKNGKTALTAMLVLAHLCGPVWRRNSQIYSAAQSRDQASLVFALAAKMVRNSVLSEYVTVRDSAKELFCARTGVRYKALSADATTAYGLSPVLVIHDELGQVRGPRSELYDALETGMGAHQDPLSIIISTQAPTDADLLSTLIDAAKASDDPTTELFLWAADPEDDPWSPDTWHKANPGLAHGLPNLQELRRTAEQAQRLPALESSFRNLHLNMRCAAEDHFLSPAVWALNSGDPDPSAFEDNPVFGGLDLSSRQDLTALVLVAQDSAGVVHVQPHFWCPAQGLRERSDRDRAPYDLWRDRGLLTATPGASVDHEYVAQCLANLAARCDLRLVKFDRWRINDLERALERIGAQVPLAPHGQGYRDMSGALDQFEALALNGRLRHGNHALMTWCASSAIVTRDAAGNRKLDRSRATGRIDGLVAAVMAVAAMSGAPEPAVPQYQMIIL